MVRTRFAPSPTGYLHIGGARTALFCWAYARRHGGKFVLRVEDTDQERSTQESVQAILDGLSWLGIDWDEGPYYQMQRLDRYREAAERLLAEGKAYRCYCTREELEAMREAQVARGEKPRYDRRWRDSSEPPPAGRSAVIRFKNPLDGEVSWNDLVKGPITVANDELDDLVLVRADGVPTYNFGVVVDDIDMAMTHVIRGDDHVNNTPRQINLYRALDAQAPHFAHVPMILGADGQRLSKRHGAVSVLQYREEGFLPDALVNYLARLGWSHGDDEVFSRDQLVEWFDLEHVSKSPARWDPEKLKWLNGEYLKRIAPADLVAGIRARNPALHAEIAEAMDAEAMTALAVGSWSLLTEHEAFLHEMASPVTSDPAVVAQYLDEKGRSVVGRLAAALEPVEWNASAVKAALQGFVKEGGYKMPEVMMPLRVAVTRKAQTKAIDAIVAALRKEVVLERLRHAAAG
ncbi:MAG: glutamate--tRNA ligase [Betaproteobacteria bacterium]|nr:glutamate--tRNA ligase [Betaproteobacteria bacterium]PWB61617.1 MAG: glutamate--tRNA ligase [Betaproteobacteria bacterium]